MPNMQQLAGQVVVITGAGRGIGKGLALGLAKEGAAIVCAARTASEIETTARLITEVGGRALAVPADVSDLNATEHLMARAVEEFGRIDIVFANAGGSWGAGTVADGDPEGWRKDIEINLIGAYNTARAAVPHLKAAGGGKIITTGSGMGHRSGPGNSAYACSKAGLWMLTRLLAMELRDDNISVNELIPGPVDTKEVESNEPAFGNDSRFAGEWIKRPKDVVPLALFLATQPNTGPTAQSFSLMRRDG